MSRRLLIRTKTYPYHITARVNNREDFPLSLREVWKFFSLELFNQITLYKIEVHAFLLMPNHYHLIATFPQISIDHAMRPFTSSITRIINTRTNRSGHLFGSRYHWSIIGNATYYAHALKYVYRNPVKASLCTAVEDWPYSTYPGIIGFEKLPFPLIHHGKEIQKFVSDDFAEQSNWLNKAYSNEESEALRKALKRRKFKIPRKASGTNLKLRQNPQV